MNYCARINIKGIVQGVRFRPIVYNLAKKYDLFGYVLNNTSGVSIEVEGNKVQVDKFVERVKNNPPPLAVILIEPLIKGNNFDLLDGISKMNILDKFHNSIA